MRKKILSFLIIGILLLNISWVWAEEAVLAPFSEIRGSSAVSLNNLSLSGDVIGASYTGSSAQFDNVDFGTEGIGGISFLVGVPSEHAGKRIEIYIDALGGEMIGYIEPKATNGFEDRKWQEAELIDGDVTGIHSVFLFYTDTGCGDIEAFQLMPYQEETNLPSDLTGSGVEQQFAALWALDVLEWDGESAFGVADNLTAGQFAKMAAMLKGTEETATLLSACGLADSAQITKGQACELLIRLLGRERLILDAEADFVQEASKAGIQIHGDRGDALNKLEAIQLLYAASEAEPVTIKRSQDGSKENVMTFEIIEDNTLLIEYRNIYKLDGVVTMDSITGLDDVSDLSKEEVLIDGYIYGTGQCDISGLLGHHITFYYEEGANENILLYVEKTQKDQSLFIEAKDVAQYSNRTLKYYDENEKQRSQKIPDNAKIIYNGLAISRYSEGLFSINSGTIELISNDGREGIEVVKIWNFTDYLAEGVVNSVLMLKDAQQFPEGIDLESGNADIMVVNSNGEPMDVERIAAENVCSIAVAEAMDGSSELYTIAVSKKTVSGMVKMIDHSERIITINDAQIPIAKAFDQNVLASINTASEIKAYLNCYGEMAFIERESVVQKLAYLIKSYTDENEDVFVRLFTEDGEMATYRCDNNLRINNIKPDNIMENLTLADGSARNEILLYTLNSQGNVRRMTFPESEADGKVDTGLYHYFDVSGATFKYNSGSLGGKSILASDFICFKIPKDLMAYDQYDIVGKATFSDDEPLVMKCYNRSQDQLDIDIGVLTYDPGSPYISDGTDIYYLSDTTIGLNADNEIAVWLEYYRGTNKTTESAPVSEENVEMALDLKRGDAIQIIKNKEGEISVINRMFSVEEGEVFKGSQNFNALIQIVSGKIYKKQGNLIQFAEEGEVFNCSGAAVYLYYGPDKALQIGDLSNLNGLDIGQGKPVYLYARYSTVRSIVVDMRN